MAEIAIQVNLLLLSLFSLLTLLGVALLIQSGTGDTLFSFSLGGLTGVTLALALAAAALAGEMPGGAAVAASPMMASPFFALSPSLASSLSRALAPAAVALAAEASLRALTSGRASSSEDIFARNKKKTKSERFVETSRFRNDDEKKNPMANDDSEASSRGKRNDVGGGSGAESEAESTSAAPAASGDAFLDAVKGVADDAAAATSVEEFESVRAGAGPDLLR